jgi:large repetitive protein
LNIDDSEGIVFNITNNNLLEINPQENYYGTSNFTLTATDSSGANSSVSFSIIVNSVNDSPMLDEVSDVSFEEFGQGGVTLTATDVDSDNLTFLVSSGNEITAESNGDSITFTPDGNYNGSEEFTVEVTDDLGSSDSQVITVTVIAVNDAPVLGEVLNVLFEEDGQGGVTLTATDVDSDNLTFSVSSGNEITAESNGDSITFTPDANYNGSEEFTVEVIDDLGSSDYQVITVTVIAVNDAPVLGEVLDVLFEEDGQGGVTLTATDIDSANLTFSVSVGNEISAEREGNTITFTAAANYNGSEQFTVEVTDDLGSSDSQEITVTVIAVNDAPVLGEVLDVLFEEDGQGGVTLTATDVDSDNLTFLVSSGNEITAESNGDSITFTPDGNYNGSEEFTVEVTDDLGSSDSQVITVTVIPVNDAPMLDEVSDVSFDEGGEGSVTLTATDVDGDNLTFSVSVGNEISAEREVNTITFTAAANYNGSEIFTVTASDGNLTDEEVVIVTVNAVNDAPIIIFDPDDVPAAVEDQLFQYQVVVTDIDNQEDEMIYSLQNKPSGMTISGSGLINWGPVDGDLSANFSVFVSDGQSSDELQMTFSVQTVDDAPIIDFTNILLDQSGIVLIDLTDYISDEETLFSSLDVSYTEPLALTFTQNSGELTIQLSDLSSSYSDTINFTVSDGFSTVTDAVDIIYSITPVLDDNIFSYFFLSKKIVLMMFIMSVILLIWIC